MLLKRILGLILVVVGVSLTVLGLGVTYSPSFSPEEMEMVWRQTLAISLIGASTAVFGGVIVFKSRN